MELLLGLVIVIAAIAFIIWLVFKILGTTVHAVLNVGHDQPKKEARKLLAARTEDVDVRDIDRVRKNLTKMTDDWEARDLYYALQELRERVTKTQCPKCKAEIDKNAEYCPSCGGKLVAYTREETEAYVQELREAPKQRNWTDTTGQG